MSGSLETGSVWQDDKQFNPSGLCLAGGLFLGYDTVIAPLMDVLTRDMARALCTSAEHLVKAVRS